MSPGKCLFEALAISPGLEETSLPVVLQLYMADCGVPQLCFYEGWISKGCDSDGGDEAVALHISGCSPAGSVSKKSAS